VRRSDDSLCFVQAMMKAVQYEHHLAQEADQHRAELLCARLADDDAISVIPAHGFFFHKLTPHEMPFLTGKTQTGCGLTSRFYKNKSRA
jgi:predicted ATPase